MGTFAVLVVLSLVVSFAAAVPSCYSSADAFVSLDIVVPQQPLQASLIQRYESRKLEINCLSFDEVGPSCGAVSIPQLCSRLSSDSSAAFTCETLSAYTSDTNAVITRGALDGPMRIWLVKWDGTGKATSCYPRQVNVRMLAFVSNERESSTTIFVIMLIIAIICVLLLLLVLILYIRDRCYRIDRAGATTIAGPRQMLRGPQMSVVEPEKAATSNVTTVYLPVRESAALNDMAIARMGQLLNDPNTPHRKSIYLEDEIAAMGGPGGDQSGSRLSRGGPASSVRKRRASPPAPGDGVLDPAFAHRMNEAKRNRNRLLRSGGGSRKRGGGAKGSDMDPDDDEFDDDPDDNFEMGADPAVVARRRALEAARRNGGGGRTPRGGRDSGNERGGSQPRRGNLFPTKQGYALSNGFDPFAGDPSDGSRFLDPSQYDPARDPEDDDEYGPNMDDDGDFDPDPQNPYEPERDHQGRPIPGTRRLDENGRPILKKKPRMRQPGGRPVAGRPNIKYVPQWMGGSFGRGGVIPEVGEADDPQPYNPRAPNEPGRSVVLPDGSLGEPPAKRYYQPTPTRAGSGGGGGPAAGSDPSRPLHNNRSTPLRANDPNAPRSALKRGPNGNNYNNNNNGPNGGPLGGNGDPEEDEEDMLRRGVSFQRDYVGGGGAPNSGEDPNGDPNHPAHPQQPGRGGGRGGNPARGFNSGGPQSPQDNFRRPNAKTHNKSLSLEKPTPSSRGPTDSQGRPIGGDGDPRRSAQFPNNGNSGSGSGGGDGALPGTDPLLDNPNATYVCSDCHGRVGPGKQPIFCPASGKRHF